MANNTRLPMNNIQRRSRRLSIANAHASKKRLQTMNDELMSLNAVLREKCERQLASAKDLRKMLAGIDAATDFLNARRQSATSHVATLTARQRQIMDLVLAGNRSKTIAADLGISQRTVENHRASIMRKTCSKSVPALARTALLAGWNDASDTA